MRKPSSANAILAAHDATQAWSKDDEPNPAKAVVCRAENILEALCP